MSNQIKQPTVDLSRDNDGRIPFYRHEGKPCEWAALLVALGADPMFQECMYIVQANLYADASVVGSKRVYRLCPNHADISINAELMKELTNDR
jgi:hypothetical protein